MSQRIASVALVAASRAAKGWTRLVHFVRPPYRPESHYMRGPGPKWRAKHQPWLTFDPAGVPRVGQHQLARVRTASRDAANPTRYSWRQPKPRCNAPYRLQNANGRRSIEANPDKRAAYGFYKPNCSSEEKTQVGTPR